MEFNFGKVDIYGKISSRHCKIDSQEKTLTKNLEIYTLLTKDHDRKSLANISKQTWILDF